MNVFRELRKIKNKNVIIRIRWLCIFLVMFISTTYAWFIATDEVEFTGIRAEVSSWDVQYFVNGEYAEETYVFDTKDFYPGMEEITEIVKIYNIGELSTNIEFEVTSVKLFGEEILNELEGANEIVHDEDAKKITLFANQEKYPFEIYYEYDKSILSQQYYDDETTPNGVALITLNVDWAYDGTDSKDVLDTGFGKKAYEYYENNPDATNALQIKMKITSSKIDS